MKVKIKRIDKTLPLPEYQTSGSVGFDIYSRETMIIAPGETGHMASNLIIETPKGYMLQISARSSLFRKKGLVMTNAIAVIDNDFCGDNDEYIIQVLNLGKESVVIERGERIVQGVFVRVDKAEWQEVEKMNSISRGRHGSTDKS